METGKAIYYLLKDSTAVGDICADRIYPEIAQQDADVPFIAYTITDTTPSGTKSGSSDLDTARVELFIVSDDYAEAMDLGIAVRGALDRQGGDIGPVGNTVAVQSIDFDTSDVDYDEQQGVYITEHTYNMRIMRTGQAGSFTVTPNNAINVSEVDGDPSGAVTNIKFSNGTVTIDGNTATVASGAGGSLTVQETGAANSDTADTLEFPADSVTHASGKATIDFTQALASAIGDVESVSGIYFANGLVGDFDQDGIVGAADLIIFLSWFGYELEDLALTVSRAQAQQDDGDSPIFQSSQHSSAVATVTALENAGQTVEFFEGINVALGRGFVSQYGDDTVSGATVRRTLYISATSFPTSLAQMQVYPLGPYDDQTKAFVQTVVDAYLAGRTANGSIVVLREEVSDTPNKLLDTYTGAAAAYSVRKLDKDYTGNCMRIRRDSDDAETDIGFDSSGDLDTAAIASHCGSANGYVVTWFDQANVGGTAVNATQSTSGLQPQIYNGTAVITENGKPILQGDTSALNISYSLNTGSRTIVAVRDLTAQNKHVFIGTNNGISDFFLADQSGSTDTAINSNVTLTSIHKNGASYTLPSNRGQLHSDLNSQSLLYIIASFSFSQTNTCLAYRNAISPGYGMHSMQELIIYPDGTTPSRTGIESNINGYFSIYT